MFSKIYIAEQLHRLLDGGDPSTDSRWDLRELCAIVGQAYNRIKYDQLKQDYYDAIRAEGHPSEVIKRNLTIFKNVEIKYDKDLDLYFADLPAKEFETPSGKAIWWVSTMQNQFNPFVPISPQFQSINKILESEAVGKTTYWIDGTQIFFRRKIDLPCKLLVKMFVFDSKNVLDESEYIEPQFQLPIIQTCFQLLGVQMPEDMILDNNPNKKISVQQS